MSKLDDAKNTRREKAKVALRSHKRAIRARLEVHKAYHPIWMGTTSIQTATRKCTDRWTLVEQAIDRFGSKNLLDLGCADGYFTRMAGEKGLFSIGVDYEHRRLSLIEGARMFDKSKNSGFVLSNIDVDFLTKLPTFDVVLFFSIMHHIWRQYPHEYGLQVLREIRRITKHVMFFDTGQSNEVSTTWASKIPDMGSDPKAWLRDFLLKGGFGKVELIGETDAFQSANTRFLFRCEV